MESNGVSLPLIHRHLMVPWNDEKKGDCCRRVEAITNGYYCKVCDFFVHKKCSDESSEYIEHPFHSAHKLQLGRNPIRFNYCNACGRRINNLFYRCEICDFDVDLYCAKYPPPEVIEVSKTHGHKLTILKERIMFECGAKCGKPGESEYPYKCDECDLAFHMDCVWNPSEVKHSSEANNNEVNEEPMNGWAELLQTLAAMQENIQAAIQNSIQKLTEAVLQQREQYHVSDNDVTGDGAGRHCDREDRRWESVFKLDIPEFHGGVKGEEVLDWLIVVEEILEFNDVPDYRKVALVATKFRGKAAIWWLQLKATRARAGKEKIKSWEKFQKLLKRSFLPYNFDRTMFNRLQNLRQGARSVDEYADEFLLLLTRNEIFDSELQLVSRFIGGLRPLIRSAMTQFVPSTVAKAHASAVAFEQELKSEAWSTDTNRFGGMASFTAPEIEEDDQNENNLGESPKNGRREFLVEEPKWDTNEHVDTEEGLLEDLTDGVEIM